MIKLRRFHESSVLAQMYDHTYDHTQWAEHKTRVQRTIEIAQALIDREGLTSVTDLSCGDGAIVDGLNIAAKIKKDFAYDPIEITSLLMKPTGLFICSETIEHLQAPWTVLEQIALKTKWLILSTPLDEDPAIGNHEHYWAFTQKDVNTILDQSGFACEDITLLTERSWTYTYQIWTGKSRVS